jgi:hypothetical protein
MMRLTLALLLATLLAACGGGGGSAAPTSTPETPSVNQPDPGNTLAVMVDSGPNGFSVNRLYTSVTICQPGNSTVCQTIDHVLVDTGSSGLRLLSSLVDPAVVQNRVQTASGKAVLNCVQFLDNSYAWGPVASADLVLGSKKVSNLPVQLIADSAYNSADGTCSASGTRFPMNSVSNIGAKGILGLGHFAQDCGTGCTTNAANGYYFSCTNTTCSTSVGTTVSLSQQLNNPVPLFASDNNGFVVDLPSVNPTGVASVNGSLIFGIGTQTNNLFAQGSILTTDSAGLFSTVFAGRTMSHSFTDTGSNGIYFDTSTLPICSTVPDFYCPAATVTLSASVKGTNAVTSTVSFQVGNAETLFLFDTPSNAVLPTLAGNIGTRTTFDWGLPFFYGRRVFIGIDKHSSPLGTGPLVAF